MSDPAVRVLAAAAMVALLAVGCSSGGGDEGVGIGTPTFPPAGEDSPAATVPAASAAADGVDLPSGGGANGAGAPDDGPAPKQVVRVDDELGDTEGGLSPDPPAWTDLTGVTMVRQNNAYAVRVELAGGDAPETSNGAETMNIAAFFDVDSDGRIDYEIWANLGPKGWGAGWFDDDGNKAYGEDSNVSISTRGDAVSILFPNVMIGTPGSLRFSISSEYGDFDVLGTSQARRDHIPNGGQVIAFP